jgi:sugar diacid utilization regulator
MSVTLDVELREERRRILSEVDGQLDDVVQVAVDAIRADIPVYGDASRTLTEDVRDHVRAHYATKVACLGAEHAVTASDLAFARAPATRRARAGLGLEDYIRAFRVGHRVFWDAVLDCAGSGAGGREAALTLATPLMRYCEVASRQAGHVFTETLQHSSADVDHDRRELLEQLLAGEYPAHGPLHALAQSYGVVPGARLLAVVAVPAGAAADAAAAGTALARAALGATRTLAVAHQGEVVAVAPGSGSRNVCERLEALHERLRAEGVPLALGVSLPAHGVAELPRAFAEARAALECVAGEGGVAALPLMSPLRFLTMSAPDTARRLVDPRLRTFLEADRRRGGALRDTIRALAETDLKLGVAAARLQVHPNTLQYRVRRIQERTGRNPRRVADLLELLTAIALDDG